MSNRVLVTDTTFILESNIREIEAAGFSVDRLNKLRASEEELIEAVQGKVGYILGGIEEVTPEVIESADMLRAISFTGSGYKEFIPGWETAKKRGIRISAAPGGNARSVAEFAYSFALALLRNLFALSAREGPGFYEGREWSALTVGVVGYGHIGKEIAKLFAQSGFRIIVAQHPGVSSHHRVVPLLELLSESDIVTIHASSHGQAILGSEEIDGLKDGAVLINAAFPEAVDVGAVYRRLQAGDSLRVGFDFQPPEDPPEELSPGTFVSMNAQSAWATTEAITRVSDRVTQSLLRLLAGKDDPDEV